jgi:hypothetical protein
MISLVLLSILALCLGFLPAYLILPGFIARMKAQNNVGVDSDDPQRTFGPLRLDELRSSTVRSSLPRRPSAACGFNMAAGYNGIESGIPLIASAAIVVVLLIKGHDAATSGPVAAEDAEKVVMTSYSLYSPGPQNY